MSNAFITIGLVGLILGPTVGTHRTTSPGDWKPANPNELVGKRITSQVSLKRAKAPASVNASGSATTTVTGPSEQTTTRVLLIKKSPAAGSLTLEQLLKRVYMTLESPLGKSVYDSDNTFERDQVTASLSQRYDPYINKSFKVEYTTKNTPTEQATSNSGFDNVWTLNLPALIATPALQGMFISRLPATVASGTAWTDTIRSDKGTTINQYQVLETNGGMLRLKIASELRPSTQPQIIHSRSGNAPATSTTTSLTYAGEMKVRQSTGFIEEVLLTKHSSTKLNAAGRDIQNNSVATVELHNMLN